MPRAATMLAAYMALSDRLELRMQYADDMATLDELKPQLERAYVWCNCLGTVIENDDKQREQRLNAQRIELPNGTVIDGKGHKAA